MGQALMTIIGEPRIGNHAGGIRQKYVLDERGRQLLLNTYDGTTATITYLAKMLGVPRWKIKNWASQAGLTRQKERRWSDADVEYLEHHLHKQSLAAIAKHLGRTKVAVQVQAKRIGVNKQGEGYTMRRLCSCLGCDHHKVERWLRHGWVKGHRRQSERVDAQGGDMWIFTQAQVRKFIITHPEEIDQRRVGWLWVVDLLAGGLGPLALPEVEREP